MIRVVWIDSNAADEAAEAVRCERSSRVHVTSPQAGFAPRRRKLRTIGFEQCSIASPILSHARRQLVAMVSPKKFSLGFILILQKNVDELLSRRNRPELLCATSATSFSMPLVTLIGQHRELGTGRYDAKTLCYSPHSPCLRRLIQAQSLKHLGFLMHLQDFCELSADFQNSGCDTAPVDLF